MLNIMALFPFTISSNAPPAAPVGRTRARWQRTGIDTLCGYVTTYRLRFSFTGRKDKNDKTMSGMGNARRHAFPGITITGYLWRTFTFKDFLPHKKTARRRFDSCSDIFSGIGRQIVFPLNVFNIVFIIFNIIWQGFVKIGAFRHIYLRRCGNLLTIAWRGVFAVTVKRIKTGEEKSSLRGESPIRASALLPPDGSSPSAGHAYGSGTRRWSAALYTLRRRRHARSA
ncbi:MAG: hypothetical protein E6X23_13110 [Mixta calida]|uniref:hypothetical protein n=1 Tax=Mixta calida TaxID=665913 RepID=UPI0012E97753|nr:hypothetical protein [Mixta calida]MDU4942464.1 hypothetical protein [Mixta calida]